MDTSKGSAPWYLSYEEFLQLHDAGSYFVDEINHHDIYSDNESSKYLNFNIFFLANVLKSVGYLFSAAQINNSPAQFHKSTLALYVAKIKLQRLLFLVPDRSNTNEGLLYSVDPASKVLG